ncbi:MULTISPECIES: hypothetical protein [unclassified Methylobacterium]|uniref:hypothetical protein n=1 Tax=unclassified Methylobacterium TaxID=2615210 RepID=UPI0036F68F96
MGAYETEFASYVLSRDFSLEVENINLTQNSEDEPLVLSGPGRIWQDEDGLLKFRVDARYDEGIFISLLLNDMNIRPGKLYDDKSYFTMTAETVNGSSYTAENVRFSSNINFSGTGEVTGELEYLSRHSVQPTTDCNKVKILAAHQDFKSWLALIGINQITIDGKKLTIQIESRDDSIIDIEVQAGSSLPQNIDMRVIEALQVLLSQKLPIAYVGAFSTRGFSEKLRRFPPIPHKSRLLPAIDLRDVGNSRAALNFLTKYLEFCLRQIKKNAWHPCSAQYMHAVEAQAGSLEVAIVGLCVAIEGVSNHLPVKYKRIEKEKVELIAEVVGRWLRKRKFSDDICFRTNGLVNQLSNVRVRDRLSNYIETGTIPSDYFATWNRQRHKAVHTSNDLFGATSDAKLQKTLDDIQKLNTLIQMMLFVIIGYEGPYVDYGAVNWPTAEFVNRSSG